MRTGGKPSWYKEGAYPAVADKDKKKDVKPVTPPPAPTPPPPAIPDAPKLYAYHADSAHYCIVVLPGLDSRTFGLKQAVKSFDSAKYSGANLELLIDMYSMNQCVMTVKKFANAAQAKAYLNDLVASPALGAYKAGEINMYVISAWNYKKMFADKTTEGYQSFYSAYYTQ